MVRSYYSSRYGCETRRNQGGNEFETSLLANFQSAEGPMKVAGGKMQPMSFYLAMNSTNHTTTLPGKTQHICNNESITETADQPSSAFIRDLFHRRHPMSDAVSLVTRTSRGHRPYEGN